MPGKRVVMNNEPSIERNTKHPMLQCILLHRRPSLQDNKRLLVGVSVGENACNVMWRNKVIVAHTQPSMHSPTEEMMLVFLVCVCSMSNCSILKLIAPSV